MEELPEYKDHVIDEDEVLKTNLKINPDFYLHLAIVQCQKAISGEDPKQNMIKFWAAVELLESITRSSGELPEGYEKEIDKIRDNDVDDADRKMWMINRRKYELCIKAAFDSKPYKGTITL